MLDVLLREGAVVLARRLKPPRVALGTPVVGDARLLQSGRFSMVTRHLVTNAVYGAQLALAQLDDAVARRVARPELRRLLAELGGVALVFSVAASDQRRLPSPLAAQRTIRVEGRWRWAAGSWRRSA